MAGYADGENNFSDDDLDDLPFNALAELENNAILSTQAANTHPPRKPVAAPSSDYGDDFDDEDLDDAVIIDESRSTPSTTRNVAGPTLQRPQNTQPTGSKSSYGNPQRPVLQAIRERDHIALPQRDSQPRPSQSSQQPAFVLDSADLMRQIAEVSFTIPYVAYN